MRQLQWLATTRGKPPPRLKCKRSCRLVANTPGKQNKAVKKMLNKQGLKYQAIVECGKRELRKPRKHLME